MFFFIFSGSESKFATLLLKSNVTSHGIGTACLTKIDSDSKLCFYRWKNIKTEGYWIALESFQKNAIIDLGKLAIYDLEIHRVRIVTAGAAAGVGAITLYLGTGSILDILIGGGDGSDPPAPINVTAINMNLHETSIILALLAFILDAFPFITSLNIVSVIFSLWRTFQGTVKCA